MTRNVIGACVALVVTLVSTGSAFGQGSVLAELYGQGVHQYFAGRYLESQQSLSMSIKQGSIDPRAYYFRGLCSSRLGLMTESESDFKKGAELEMAASDRIYPIGRSLQRVQGRDRLLLEQHRQSARLAARLRAVEIQQARYENLGRAESRVLRDPNRRPANSSSELVGPAPASDPSDPFTQAEVAPAVAPPAPTLIDTAATPKTAATPAAAAATPSASPVKAADADPFGASAPPAPASTPAPVEDDPFGDPFN